MTKFIFITLIAITMALTSAIQPVNNFNASLLYENTGTWTLQSVYDPTGRNWTEVACVVTTFAQGESAGIISNRTTAFSSLVGNFSGYHPLYYKTDNQSVFYYDSDETIINFFVASANKTNSTLYNGTIVYYT